MKKTLAVIALSTLLAAPALADSQPADTESGGLTMKMKGISLNFGGFIEAASIYRSRNENSDVTSKFQSLPAPGSVQSYQDETRFSARQTRFNILASGDVSPTIHLAGYYEMDFLGAASTANSNETNSYNPRIRHLYTTADWDSLGLHILAGQTWSLVTMNNKGITPHNEVTPLTIEAQYVPGFTFARQPQFRITKDFNKQLWLAVSVENPQSTSSVATFTSATNPNNAAQGSAATGSNLGSLSGVSLSQNDVPDVVFKAAFEPGWGHFEVYDLLRTFKSTLGANATASQETTVNAVGGGVILPLIPKHLTLQVSGAYGRGLGRYGAGQLADATEDVTGLFVPLTETQLLAGIIYDPTSDWNFYGYYGLEQVQRVDLASGGKPYGYGSALSVAGASLQRVDQITAGTWWKFLQGNYGRMQAGLQYSYTEDKYFSGATSATKTAKIAGPKSTDQMAFVSLRYYWQ
jgi:hypothetical protein